MPVFLLGAGFNRDAKQEAGRIIGEHNPKYEINWEYPLVTDLVSKCFERDSLGTGETIEQLFASAIEAGNYKPLKELYNILMHADYYIPGRLTSAGLCFTTGSNIPHLILMPTSFTNTNTAKAVSPLTVSCPQCHSRKIIKKGTRKTVHDRRQRHGCKACGHTFINQATKHSGYPVKLIMEAISHYNLGHSATKTLRYLTRRFGIRVPENTFRFWYTQHKPICTYHSIRSAIKQQHEPAALIERRTLEHKQVYLYQYHRGKLDYL